MKRIIDGKTYNTETSTKIDAEWQHPQSPTFNDLYQTRHGAYFRSYGDDEIWQLQPLTPQQAQAWMESHSDPELLEQHFGEQPEAGESESRLTVRIPDALKVRIEAAAETNNQSLNAWIMRCLERAVADQRSTEEKK